MSDINARLGQQGLDLAVEQIELFTIGGGRPSNRIHQQPFRWVPGDPRRIAQGTNITYLVDASYQGTASGVSAADTSAAIDRSMETWSEERCLKKVSLVKQDDPGSDPTIFDEFFPTGDDEPMPGQSVPRGYRQRGLLSSKLFRRRHGRPGQRPRVLRYLHLPGWKRQSK